MSWRPLVFSVLPFVAASLGVHAGCSSSAERSSFEDAGSSSGGGSGDAGGSSSSSSTGGITGSTDGGNQSGCSDAAKLVYVLSGDYELYSFNPAALEFARIGELDCPTDERNVSPNSMAIDRSGTAWVGYQNGELFKVDTSDASCTATGFDYRNQQFDKYGMGFSSNAAGSSEESLFLVGMRRTGSGDVGRGLFRLDTGSLEATALGDFSGNLEGETAELTGTGDAKLYGFFATSPAVVAQVDKSTGATSNPIELDTVSLGGGAYAFAFSYWGGDFWLYSSNGSTPSKVSRLRTSSDGEESVVVQNVGGFQIVGAGVSTCAPTSPVN